MLSNNKENNNNSNNNSGNIRDNNRNNSRIEGGEKDITNKDKILESTSNLSEPLYTSSTSSNNNNR